MNPVTDYARHEQVDTFVKIVLRDDFIKPRLLPSIEYLIPVTELIGDNNDAEHTLYQLLAWLQAYSEYDPNCWREVEPAITQLSDILSTKATSTKLSLETEK